MRPRFFGFNISLVLHFDRGNLLCVNYIFMINKSLSQMGPVSSQSGFSGRGGQVGVILGQCGQGGPGYGQG